MIKLCIIYNHAALYRTSIFTLIDKEFNCDWLFGNSKNDVKEMDHNLLHGNIKDTHTKRLFKGWYWQPGVIGKLRQNYTHYILLGETRALSTWMFCILARLFCPKKKVYFWSHGWYGKEKPLEKIIKKILFRLPNGGVFLYGNYARNLMIKEGFSSDKLFVIHNSLAYDKQLEIRKQLSHSDIYRNHFKNNSYNLIFIGRLTKIKRIDLLVDAMALLRKQGYEYNLTLVGDGTETETLLSRVQMRGLQKNVWFYGACYDEKENATLIYNADLCVSPGNVGLTAMHVMMFGCPVITHDNFPYQMPEFEAIQKNTTGDFFKQGDIVSLAETIKKWFTTDNSGRKRIGQSCYNEIDSLWTPQYQIKVLKEVLKP